jgi:hypothetical protein
VHAVVTGHGGDVTVAGTAGRTVFTVRLPHAAVVEPDEDDLDEWDAVPLGPPEHAGEAATR